MSADPIPQTIPQPLRRTVPEGARIVAYQCSTHATFRVLWPEVDAPLVHPRPECDGAALRLIGTRSDTV